MASNKSLGTAFRCMVGGRAGGVGVEVIVQMMRIASCCFTGLEVATSSRLTN